MNLLAVGMNVEIKRSDGRVHLAIISDILPAKNSVHVEWFEKGETKGKEIDIATLLELNRTLQVQQQKAATAGHSPGSKAASNHALSPSYDDNDENDETLDNIQLPKAKKAPAKKTHQAVAPSQQTSSAISPPTQAEKTTTKAAAAAETRTGNSQAASGIPKTGSQMNITMASNEIVSNGKSSAAASNAPTTSNAGFALPASIAVKSSTVQNIEKMQKDREERRAQQEREKKRAEFEKQLDPGNPNYQFLVMIRDYQANIDYRPLKMSDSVADNRIAVCVRKRPMSKKELARKEIEVITIPNRDHVIVHQPQVKVDLTKFLENQKFRYDYAFDESASNEMVYKFTAQPLVRTLFDGGHATCFAYGQTGSGKTHTMGGDFTSGAKGAQQNAATGIYALTATDIFKQLHNYKGFTVGCAFFEIYGNKVFDLLNDKKLLRVLEDGNKEVQVVGLSEDGVQKEKDVIEVIRKGSAVRTAGTTSANINSSRSHAVFQFILRKGKKVHGKFSLVDLAGNERGQDTGNADRQTRLEGAEINKSLLALKECIRAMGRKSNHVPFRGNVLMQVLRDSFIGNKSKTCMIAMVSPSMSSCEHTLNTLRYAYQVKELDVDGTGAATPLDNAQLMLPPRNEDEDDSFEDEEEEEDLQLVCNRSGANREMMDYYRVIAKLGHAETKALDEYGKFIDDLDGQFTQSRAVDYDQEKFVREALETFANAKQRISACEDALKKWQKLIVEESTASASLRSRAKK
ncbi:hypothetical protein WR25_00204 [Diploscapter pachys]|uniref:Kinesin-like protein n=1 Tax=Diploscapter pachys TaxID=2018661 RepID=A0A2A2J4I8_9BILA|nr:hypothetical protein WR25_00204 [Diploscapter pachys]